MTDPREFKRVEKLKNGLVVTIRAVRADDRNRVAKAFRLLDRESVYRRFFAYKSELTDAELDRAVQFDWDREVALVATVPSGGDEVIIAAGRYIVVGRAPGRTAELAFVVEEDFQNLGVASHLLRQLVAIARQHGIETFEADVLAENESMRAVFARSGLPMRVERDQGVLRIMLSL